MGDIKNVSLLTRILLSCCFLLAQVLRPWWAIPAQETPRTGSEGYVISFGMSSVAVKREEAKVRQRLWSRFSARQRDSFRATWFTKEGEPSTFEFSVEPGLQGDWQVRVQVTRHLRERGSPNTQRKYVLRDAYVASKLIVMDLSGKEVSQPSTTDVNFFKDHKLMLTDAVGKVLQNI
jgi:hypothetical protein